MYINKYMPMYYITFIPFSANPAVFTSKSEIRVGLITNTIIDVLVDGNPIPTANDIEWFFNGSIVSDNEYYQVNNGNKQLRIINASSDNVTGVYQCKVTTSTGNNSVYVIVSYHGKSDDSHVIVISYIRV